MNAQIHGELGLHMTRELEQHEHESMLMNWEQAQDDFGMRITFETRLKAYQRDNEALAKEYMDKHLDAINVLLGVLDIFDGNLMTEYKDAQYAYGSFLQVIGNTTRQFQRLLRILAPIPQETITQCLDTIATDRPMDELINGIDHFDEVLLGALFAERQARVAQTSFEDWDSGNVIVGGEEE